MCPQLSSNVNVVIGYGQNKKIHKKNAAYFFSYEHVSKKSKCFIFIMSCIAWHPIIIYSLEDHVTYIYTNMFGQLNSINGCYRFERNMLITKCHKIKNSFSSQDYLHLYNFYSLFLDIPQFTFPLIFTFQSTNFRKQLAIYKCNFQYTRTCTHIN